MNQPTTEINEATQFAGFWIRVGAYFIDMVLLLIPNLLISFLYRSIAPSTNAIEMVFRDIFPVCLSMIVWWIYYAVLYSSVWQASVGKKVLGLKVVGKNGDRISFGRATGRYASYVVSGLICGIGYMMIGWTKKKRGLHDMIAGTYVIKANNA